MYMNYICKYKLKLEATADHLLLFTTIGKAMFTHINATLLGQNCDKHIQAQTDSKTLSAHYVS